MRLLFQRVLILTALLLFLPQTGICQNTTLPRSAILIFPPEASGAWSIEPGKKVEIISFQNNETICRIKYNDQVYEGIERHQILPLDLEMAFYRVLLALKKRESPNCAIGTLQFSQDVEHIKYLFLFAKNSAEVFSDHEDSEEIFYLACKFAELYEQTLPDYKSRGCYRQPAYKAYLNKFSNGFRSDEIKWALYEDTCRPLEYEGFIEPAIKEIKEYEKFLFENPKSSQNQKIRLTIAHLCRYISALPDAEDSRLIASHPVKFCKEYGIKGLKLYKELAQSSEIEVKAIARVCLYFFKKPQPQITPRSEMAIEW